MLAGQPKNYYPRKIKQTDTQKTIQFRIHPNNHYIVVTIQMIEMNQIPEAPVAQLASLEEVLAYQNQDIIDKFLENWSVSEDEAKEIFEETKKWLWISAKGIAEEPDPAKRQVLAITNSMTLLDEMWHTFILFTSEYLVFCKRYFGFYLHHAPTTKSQKEESLAAYQSDPEAYIAKIEAENTAQFSHIYDQLGQETLLKWYSEWTDKITPDYLDSIRKAAWR